MSWQTLSGKWVDLGSLSEDDVDLGDIARGLSRTMRYRGQTLVPYSVAQHSVTLASIVPVPLKAAALMHDSAEYILGDFIYNDKNLVFYKIGLEYVSAKDVELKLQGVIFSKFGLDLSLLPDVVWYDRAIRWNECSLLRPGLWFNEQQRLDIPDMKKVWSPEQAETLFLQAANTLGLTQWETEQ